MSLEQRVLAAVAGAAEESAWDKLIRLFEADREAFYELAGGTLGAPHDPRLRDVATLAALVRDAVWETYEITSSHEGPTLTTFKEKRVLIPEDLRERVAAFLLAVDGKGATKVSGRDFEGTEVSQSEVRFTLGDPGTRDARRAELQRLRQTRRRVLKVDQEDLEHLLSLPPYVTHELLNCARRVVLNPTGLFKGLRRGDGSPGEVNGGWAFCGKPRVAYHNDGTPHAAPSGMVYVVYADANNYVFDWDWVREHPHDAGMPLDWNMRFGNPHPMDVESVLDLPLALPPGQLDDAQACYSERGDCIFCYMTDRESFAERVNGDLTVFRDRETEDCVGFKIKNVRRILERDQSIVIKDAPDLTVRVDSVLLASLKRHPEQAVDVYQVLIKALYKRAHEPPRVKLRPQIALAASE